MFMRRLFRVLLILIIVVGVATACWHEFRPGGRRHQGRTENEWIASLTTPPGEKEMQQWRALGAEAVPMLARALGTGTSPIERWYFNHWFKLPEAVKKRLAVPRITVTIRRNASAVLGGLTCDISKAAPALGRALHDEDEYVRVDAAICLNSALPKLGQDKSRILPDLLQAMQDTNHLVRENATQCLRNYEEQSRTVGPVLEKALGDPEEHNRYIAVQALKRLDQEEAGKGGAESILIRSLTNDDLIVCVNAALVLSEMKWNPGREVLEITKMLNDDRPGKQRMVAMALGKYGPEASSAIPALKHAFETGEPRVREAASNALVEIEPRAAAREFASPNEPVPIAKP
jgi:HEAT repeat protein